MKRFLAFFVFLLLGVTTVYAEEIEEPRDLYAHSAVLMDADSGRVLFEKNGNEIMANASTTKIMTCILALEEGDLNDIVTVSSEAAAQPKVHLGMKEGEKFHLRDLLYSLMLESHNDSAVAIAEHLAGSVKSFAEKMNQKARKIGCYDTHFVTPNGLDKEDEGGAHATTATDLARIMSYCVLESPKKDTFLAITGAAAHNFTNLQGDRKFACTNHNSFLTMMDGAISGKTGFTGKAGYCYVGAVRQGDRTFVVALLACGWPNNKTYKWSDTRKLMEYGLKNYTYRDVFEEIELPEIKVEGGVPQSESMFGESYTQLKVDVSSEEELKVLLRADENVEVKTEYDTTLFAPLVYGREVGKVTYYLNGEKIKTYPIIIGKSVEKKDLAWYFEKIMKLYFCAD